MPRTQRGEQSVKLGHEAGEAVEVAELRGHCREHLAPQKTPAVSVQVSDFPLTGSGKIQKFALRDGFEAGEYDPL